MTLSQITAKYLKGQKKHTVMSLIAITVSVAFMTVLLCALSVYRATSRSIAENKNGTYEVVFNSITKDQLLSIRNMDIFSETEIYGVSSYTSSTELNHEQMKETGDSQHYLIREGYLINDVFLRMDADKVTLLPSSMRECTEGRMPTADGEIVLANSSAYMWGYPNIGDTVTATLAECKYKEGNGEESDLVPEVLSENFDIAGVKEVSFTVVGFTNNYNVVCYNDTNLSSYTNRFDHVLARFAEGTNSFYWDMHYAFADAGYEIDDFDYGLNQQLLNAENKGVDAHFSTALFFIVMYLFLIFIMFCARLVIDDSFEISAKERIKQFGLLKAVGASRKQIFRMLVTEALMLGIPGVVMGIALGMGLSLVIFNILRGLAYSSKLDFGYNLGEMFVFEIRPYVFITAVVLGLLWVMISAVATGLRSIRSTPVEALHAARHTEKVKIPKKPTSLERGGSFIGAYSSVSIKRNRKRYVITIVSMVLSIVLFTGFSYAVELMQEKTEKDFSPENVPYDYVISSVSVYPYVSIAEQNELIDSGLFKNTQCYTSMNIYSDTPEDLGVDPEYYVDYGLIQIKPVTKETFDSFIKTESGITYEELSESGKILIDPVTYDDNDEPAGTVISTLPESIRGVPFSSEALNMNEDAMTIGVAGFYSSDNSLFRSYGGRLSAVMSEPAYYAIYDKVDHMDNTTIANRVETDGESSIEYYYSRAIYASSTGNREQEKLFLDRNFYDSYIDVISQRDNARATLDMTKLIGYFIIAIISVIAVINIANIISANVLNRSSELAMLRACGMSDKQVYSLLLTESFRYAGISGIIGAILTEGIIFAMRMPFTAAIHDLYFDDIGITFTYLPTVKYLVISVAAAFIVAALASLLPARRTINSPIVENIRNMES